MGIASAATTTAWLSRQGLRGFQQLPHLRHHSLWCGVSLPSHVEKSRVGRTGIAIRQHTRVGSTPRAMLAAPSWGEWELPIPPPVRDARGFPKLTPNLQGLLERVRECNLGAERRSEFLPFYVGGILAGYVHHTFAAHLRRFPDVFNVAESITLNPELRSEAERTSAVNPALDVLRAKGVITGWRDELLAVNPGDFHSPPLLCMERAACHMFGIQAFGVHMNGYVVDAEGRKYLWVARRSLDKPTYPGKLDHLAAGALPYGLTCRENLIKECQEEAGIPRELSSKAVPVGAVSYETVEDDELKRIVLFTYDLELPADFRPRNTDGEVQDFKLLPVEDVMYIVQTAPLYKPNCSIVVIDFLIRHGYLTPDHKGYMEVLIALRSGTL